MFRFTTATLLRLTVVVAGWALLLRANCSGSAQSRFVAAAIYAGMMMLILYIHRRQEAKKAMMPDNHELETRPE
jgi:hypothetical protein